MIYLLGRVIIISPNKKVTTHLFIDTNADYFSNVPNSDCLNESNRIEIF